MLISVALTHKPITSQNSTTPGDREGIGKVKLGVKGSIIVGIKLGIAMIIRTPYAPSSLSQQSYQPQDVATVDTTELLSLPAGHESPGSVLCGRVYCEARPRSLTI